MKFIDRVKETTATTGTGDFVLAGVVAGFQGFAGYAVGERVPYCAAFGAEWEVGIGTKAASSIARTTVTASSNGGALVNFSAGTKELYVNAGAAFLSSVSQTSAAAFSQAIPLSVPGATYMAPYTVTGPLTFTAMAGAVQGALSYLRLTADGTNAPNFSAFKEWGGSSGYDNRNGIVNQLQFFYDGADLFYTASQAIGAVPVATAPATMAAPTATAGVTSASIAFVAPANGGAAITGYTVTASTGQTATGTVSPIPITMPANVAVTFTIYATNSVGNGSPSPASNSVTPTAAATAPAQMAAPTATAGNGAVSVAYSAPADGGSAITGYTATWSGGQSVTGTANPLVITGVTNGTAGTATIYATNAVGNGTPSPASNNVTPAAPTVPGAPTIGTAVAGDGYIDVAFTAPASNGGSAILDYTATLSTAQTATGATSPVRVTAPNGTAASATVTARNAVGSSVASAASNSVTPAAVSAVAIRLSPRSADLTESASAPWVYSGTGPAYSGVIGGIATQKLQSGIDGSLSQKFTGTPNSEIMIGVQAGSTVVAFASLICAFYTEKVSGNYKPFTTGGAQTATNLVAVANGDVQRMRRTGTSVIAEVSKDAGATWTTIYTWTAQPTGVLYFQSVVGTAAGTITDLVGVGLA